MTEQGCQKDYELLIGDIKKIPKDQVRFCTMPIDVAVGEAHRLDRVLVVDRQTMLDAGIAPGIVDSFSARVGALDFAAAEYRMTISKDPDSVKAWEEASAEGYELRRYLFKHMSFAFRKEAELMAQLKLIKDGRGDLDMVAALMSAKRLGEKTIAYLVQTPLFDRGKLQAAEDLHNRLNVLHADATIDPAKVNQAKDIFHRAWTYYKMAADEIKDYGQYVFEGTDRYQEYVSEYLSSKASKSAKTSSEQTESESLSA